MNHSEQRQTERRLAVDDTVRLRANRRPVRLAVDLLGVLGIVAGAWTATFTLVFGGALVLMAGACLHATCRHRSRPC
ncbi:hypothetical protein SAMN05216188_114165 [Lentzea xinjiangensis]|uniref:Uncharacterized protein n=1 Tax=Lentzea xinjiangensis TaxID=402600 RepID=A0A1H9RID4_9PSEU|nr:hypothetical protein [Lentzea xinjiangensis]SER72408.1 hypothetical protein SAMN05216188_114165 [Lentzea xinjiangensis]